jgi:hypothetical protein
MTTEITIPADTDVQRLIDALNAAHQAGIKFAIGPNPHIAWDEIGQQYAPAGELLRDQEFEATWAGGHALVIEYGDEEMHGRCQCGARFGTNTPDKTLDAYASPWEQHVLGLQR